MHNLCASIWYLQYVDIWVRVQCTSQQKNKIRADELENDNEETNKQNEYPIVCEWLTVGESRFRCGKSKSRICTKPIESWLDRLRTISGVSALSNETVCESDISRPRRHLVSASITSSVARSDMEMAKLCSTSLPIGTERKQTPASVLFVAYSKLTMKTSNKSW